MISGPEDLRIVYSRNDERETNAIRKHVEEGE